MSQLAQVCEPEFTSSTHIHAGWGWGPSWNPSTWEIEAGIPESSWPAGQTSNALSSAARAQLNKGVIITSLRKFLQIPFYINICPT